ncbi:MAG: hypothetical protein K9K76_02055 [Halanaerobiales bacterium]|nr:hypothetical protein [Halanaerobiales bacterium]
MKYKIILFIFILILLFTIPIMGKDLEASYIQELISKGKRDKALKLLNNTDIESNPDLLYYKALLLSWNEEYELALDILTDLIKKHPDRLDFYNQKARIYGWMGNYKKASEIIERAQKKEISPVRTTILAQHAEWQNKWFEAVKLRKKAFEQVEDNELKTEYKSKWRKARKNILPTNFIKMEFTYNEDNQSDLYSNILLGQERPIKDGLKIEGSGGIRFLKNEINFLARTNLSIKRPILPPKMSLDSNLNFSGGKNSEIHYNSKLNYILNSKNTLGLFINFYEFNDQKDYQTVELQNEYKYKNSVITFKNTSRHNVDGWNYDFSQHLDLYYPFDSYLLHLTLSHYDGGEYVFRAGFEISDIFLNEEWKINNLYSWLNNKSTGMINVKLDRKK